MCPACRRSRDIPELDRHVGIRDIYAVDASGNITGFTPKESRSSTFASTVLGGSHGPTCQCGSPFHAIRRYSIVKQLQQSPIIFDRLLAKIGKSINVFSRRINYQRKELDDSFTTFRNAIRPNPLAAAHNKSLVASRVQSLLTLSGNIQEFNTSTAMAFERSLSWLQEVFPGILGATQDGAMNGNCGTPTPTFTLRLSILQRRARNLWIFDCLRMSKYLENLEDPSLEVQRMGKLLRFRASKESWKGIGECEEVLSRTENLPAIEVEVRLQQIQLHHLLNIALAEGAGAQHETPSMASEAPTESLQQAMELCRRFPDTAGRFTNLVTNFCKASQNKKQSRTAFTLSTLPQTHAFETCRTEWLWGEHVVGHLEICERAGHPYCAANVAEGKWAGCPECGREKTLREGMGMEEEGRKAGESLFESKFLEMMRKR
jgi:hypothetical protein